MVIYIENNDEDIDLDDYVDYEKLGGDFIQETQGAFTKYGYVYKL